MLEICHFFDFEYITKPYQLLSLEFLSNQRTRIYSITFG